MSNFALAFVQEAEIVRGPGITTGALAFMLIMMGLVIALLIWCYLRILTTKDHFDPDGTGPAVPPVPGREERDGV